MRRRRILLLALLAAACRSPQASRPLSAIDAYIAALEAGEYSRAYDLMSEKYKKEHTREEFVRMLRESPGDVRETASRLRSGRRDVVVRAHYVYDDLRDELHLVEEGGSWRIDSNPLEFYPQDTPRNALRSFVRAVELKRYDIILRFVPNTYRQEMSEDKLREEFEGAKREEVANLVRTLRGAIDNPIEQQGDEARMPYGDRSEVRFRREEGVWKIEDFD